eukprot:gene17263-20538_t
MCGAASDDQSSEHVGEWYRSAEVQSNAGSGNWIPTQLGNMIDIWTMNLNTCGLSGTLPSELGRLENLAEL